MTKMNTRDIVEESWTSPKGKFAGSSCVVADNPIGESVYYHDSKKWGVRSPEWRVFRGEPLEDYEGEK
ncbi:MAG TPA: hypothetical protein VIS96_12720 [Terrimicrobiaceae bacterium]